MARTFLQRVHGWLRVVQNNQSKEFNGGLRLFRLRTATGCRSARTSRAE